MSFFKRLSKKIGKIGKRTVGNLGAVVGAGGVFGGAAQALAGATSGLKNPTPADSAIIAANKATDAADTKLKVGLDANNIIRKRLGLDPTDVGPQTSVGGALGDPAVAAAAEEERKRRLAAEAAAAASQPKTILGGKRMGFSLGKLFKKVTKKGLGKTLAQIPGVGQTLKAVANVADKGVGAFTLGQITGSDRAKLLAKRDVAAAEADQGPVDPNSPDLKAGSMPTFDSAAVEEERKRALLRASMRGGRRSTIISDTEY